MKNCNKCKRESNVLSTCGNCARCVEDTLNDVSKLLINKNIEVDRLETKIRVLEKMISTALKDGFFK